MKRFKLAAEPRKVIGKKVKKLRRDGILPANVYGKDMKSQSLQLPQSEFEKVFKEAGETGVIDLAFDGQAIPVLIHNIHTDYRNRVLHADFYKVNLKEKVHAAVPLEFVGEAKAVSEEIGLLMELTNEVEVEALPTELPEKIEVNVENLANIGDQITIADLPKTEGVEIQNDPNQVVAKIDELVSEEALKQAEEEAAAAEAAASAAAEGAEPAEGEEAAGGETTEAQPKEGEQAPSDQKSEEPK